MGIKKEYIAQLIEKLESEYGPPPKPDKKLPILDQILVHILEANEVPEKVQQAYQSLVSEFVDWNEIRVSHPREIQDVLGEYLEFNVHEKAHRIREVLGQIFNICNQMDLEFLWEKDFSEIQKFIQQLYGLPEDFIFKVVCYSYYRPEFHLSPAFIRLAKRLQLLNDSGSPANLKKVLAKELGPEKFFTLQVLFYEHGEKFCTTKNYDCCHCAIASLCEKGEKESDRKPESKDKAPPKNGESENKQEKKSAKSKTTKAIKPEKKPAEKKSAKKTAKASKGKGTAGKK